MVACSPRPYRAANLEYRRSVRGYSDLLKTYPLQDSVGGGVKGNWVGTTNFNMRKPNFVVIHHTAQNSCDETLKTFTLKRTQVSAHYVICRDGSVYHMLNDYLRAWHAGSGRWGNVTDMNSESIGIELDNNGEEVFGTQQMDALYALLGRLKRSYGIPDANFIGHEDVAPTRKNDPSVYFDWKGLADKGFGLWYGDTTGVVVPKDFNAMQGLRIVGYDVRDTSAAIAVFKRKYLGVDKSRELGDGDLKVLYLLMMKYL